MSMIFRCSLIISRHFESGQEYNICQYKSKLCRNPILGVQDCYQSSNVVESRIIDKDESQNGSGIIAIKL